MNNIAELLGAIAGDGHIDYGKKYGRGTHYKLVFSGSFTEDLEYYKKVEKFLSKLSPKKIYFYKQRRDELAVCTHSKELLEYLIKKGAIYGRKTKKIDIPKWLNNKEKLHFLRGLFDTDGCLTFKKKYKDKVHKYPMVLITLKSKNMISKVSSILKENDFYFYTGYYEKNTDKRNGKSYERHSIYISGRKNLKKWMSLIGFNNPKHITKYQVWKKFGYCPRYTNLRQRKKILNNTLNPLSFYK